MTGVTAPDTAGSEGEKGERTLDESAETGGGEGGYHRRVRWENREANKIVCSLEFSMRFGTQG